MSDYTPTGAPPAQTRGISSSIRAEFDLIATAVNSKPDTDTTNTYTSAQTFSAGIVTVGGTYTGVNDFSGASSVLVPTPTLSAQAVTKSYADGLSFATALPAQAGNSGKFVTTDGTTASWALPIADQSGNSGKVLTTNGTTSSWSSVKTVNSQSLLGSGDISSGLTLIATLTPTAAANVDFLTTFTSTYDNYLIIGQGIKPSSDDALLMRFSVAGSVDTGSNYFSSANTSVAAGSSMYVTSTVTSAGKGGGFTVQIQNANDSSNAKTGIAQAMTQDGAGPGFVGVTRGIAYNAANAISGFRLYWSGGANFAATGRVRVYGYSKT